MSLVQGGALTVAGGLEEKRGKLSLLAGVIMLLSGEVQKKIYCLQSNGISKCVIAIQIYSPLLSAELFMKIMTIFFDNL